MSMRSSIVYNEQHRIHIYEDLEYGTYHFQLGNWETEVSLEEIKEFRTQIDKWIRNRQAEEEVTKRLLGDE